MARIIDGDTLEVGGQQVRLLMVDTPERDQVCQTKTGKDWPCGKLATEALMAKIGGAPVRCEGHKLDRYGWLLARCTGGSEDLSGWLVRQGHAVATSKTYATEQDSAKRMGRGVWQGPFTTPADFRAARTAAPGG